MGKISHALLCIDIYIRNLYVKYYFHELEFDVI